jgi:hypothetical protein
VSKQDLLAVAVPHSPRFAKLARRWREAPLIKRLGIHILTVGRDGDVDGLSARSLESFRRHQEAVVVQEALDSIVKREFCAATPAPNVMDYPAYVNFARAGRPIIEKWHAGCQLDSSMAILVEDWTSKGCTRELLLRIAQACFDWTPSGGRPATPPGK